MKKKLAKLAMRAETIRALVSYELRPVVGARGKSISGLPLCGTCNYATECACPPQDENGQVT